MAEIAEAKIIPPKSVADKVTGTKGPLEEEILLRINRRIELLANDYVSRSNYEMALLSKLLHDAFEAEFPGVPLKKLHVATHDIRGQGGSFGYPLVTDLSTGLCRFLETIQTLDSLDEDARTICFGYVDAIANIFRNSKKGQGDDIDRKVSDSLRQASRFYAHKRKLSLVG